VQHLFLDESGDHDLTSIDAAYPVFVLGGVIVQDDADLALIGATMRSFKTDFLGDDRLILHTADITRNRKGFERLADVRERARFHAGLNGLMAGLPFSIVAWDLLRLHGTRYVRPDAIARRIPTLEFRSKNDGEVGLELADLVVTPLGRWVAGMPDKPDLEVVRAKLRTRPNGSWEGAGLVVLPKESGRGPLRNTRPPRV
jgi:hypothetical protein